ncbi:hypothetical protein HMPREF0454_01177 [Hafnia alvei ATCC 51873]|uniref:Uncharacterized protein n=1 Tax=Hafnia alvei ATCC 51873 TaxID=1002364 RepID=G9Y3P7_HAFAL|nr:hypothetical protein HMPREF0454_01177 [Hafnia alvei ATCC 51873]
MAYFYETLTGQALSGCFKIVLFVLNLINPAKIVESLRIFLPQT